jgi:hypothetical protein
MTVVLAIVAVLYVAIRLRAGASRPGAHTSPGVRTCGSTSGGDGRLEMPTADDELCLEYSDEELESWGLSREQMRALELQHYEESAFDDNGPEDGRRMRPLRPPYRFHLGRRATPRVHRPMRRSSYSRRAPRRARPSRRARPAARTAPDPEPAPACLGLRDLFQEGGRP